LGLLRILRLIAAFILVMIGVCQLAAMVKFGPYDLTPA
jgi:iron(III) transport system permease protein